MASLLPLPVTRSLAQATTAARAAALATTAAVSALSAKSAVSVATVAYVVSVVSAVSMAGMVTGGCIAAAAAGAGAATAAYVTTRGAKAVVDAPVDRASSNAQAILAERHISLSGQSSERSGARREFKGSTREGEEVTITLSQDGKNAHLTEVEVNVKKNAVEWDQGLAKQIADELVSRAGRG